VPVCSFIQLETLLRALADHFGMDRDEKAAWVEQTLQAELRGNLMQGLAYFEHHNLQRLTNGVTALGSRPSIIRETPAMAVLDAHGALGPLVAKIAMSLACRKARDVGCATVAVRDSTDWNMISYAARQALRHGCVGLVFCNSRPEVAPWGGTRAVYGMNPFAVAIPTRRHHPILIDMCSSDSGGLDAMRHLILKDRLPDTVQFFDRTGRLVERVDAWGTNAGWGLAAGAQRMTGYRDMALTVMMDCLAGALTGMQCAMALAVPELLADSPRTPRGQLVIALHVEAFTPFADFTAKIDRAIDEAKAAPLAPGHSEILMPGERGFREEDRRRRDGVPILDEVWSRLRDLMRPRGVDIDAITGSVLPNSPAQP
jgi:LDH2 family malate/lactate/ureidoglycolate dehydrogenase